MKKVKLIILNIIMPLALVLGTGAVLTPVVNAQTPKDAACQGVALTGGNCDAVTADGKNAADSTVNKLIATIINIFSLVVGVTSVIMIIIGGFKYITSGGDSASVSSAKNTILYSLIGLVIVAFAQVIVQFVLKKL